MAKLTLIFLLAINCGLSCTRSPELLSFHLVRPSSGWPGTVAKCRAVDAVPLRLLVPTGAFRDVFAASESSLSIPLSLVESIELFRAQSTESSPSAVSAFARLSPTDMHHFQERRRALVPCRFLVLLDGKPVGFDPTGDWQLGVPAGVFASFSEAERTYSAIDQFVRHEADPVAARSDLEWERWLLLRDSYQFHCEPDAKTSIRGANPEAFDALNALDPPDCTLPLPSPPGS